MIGSIFARKQPTSVTGYRPRIKYGVTFFRRYDGTKTVQMRLPWETLPKQVQNANLQARMETAQMTTQQYERTSQHFLEQAKRELADGDLAQASEKGWGATAQMLKAIAEQRGWDHSRHRHYHRAASRLRSETGDGDIHRLFAVASALHENFYENDMDADLVAESLGDVEVLLAKLAPLLTRS